MKRLPISPFLFAIFPILMLLGNNIDQVVFTISIRSLAISMLGACVFVLMFRMIFRDWSLAAVITSICLFLFYSYGHTYQWINSLGEIGGNIGRHRFLLPLWIVLLILGIYLTRRKRADLGAFMMTLNIAGIVAVVLPVIQIISFSYQTHVVRSLNAENWSQEDELYISDGQAPPDIYYFILDAYTRQDVLLETIDYDNSEFLRNLEELGFYVAYCSQSNYAQTNLSMASTFNLDYLHNILGDLTTGDARNRIPGFIQNNVVRNSLEELGYTIVAFETGFYAIQWMDANVYLLPPRSKSSGDFFNVTKINNFEAMLLQTTAAWALVDLMDLPDQLAKLLPDLSAPINVYRERTLYVLDQFTIDRVPSINGPKFVYVHLILPHSPYVFGPDGEIINEEKDDFDLDAYRDQLIYTNKRILDIVTRLFRSARKPNIIILQGDHGLLLDPADRVAILNAYYFSDGDDEWLYRSISPVNTFRGIFNQYFHADYEYLKDVSYFSMYDDPFDFEIVPPTANEKCTINVDAR